VCGTEPQPCDRENKHLEATANHKHHSFLFGGFANAGNKKVARTTKPPTQTQAIPNTQ
jgi:hypothetical protein